MSLTKPVLDSISAAMSDATKDNKQQFTQAALANTADSLGFSDVADHIDPQGRARIAELERFCAELGRELETVQRERLALWEENRRLSLALEAIAAIHHFRKPTVTWSDLAQDAIRIAEESLANKGAK